MDFSSFVGEHWCLGTVDVLGLQRELGDVSRAALCPPLPKQLGCVLTLLRTYKGSQKAVGLWTHYLIVWYCQGTHVCYCSPISRTCDIYMYIVDYMSYCVPLINRELFEPYLRLVVAACSLNSVSKIHFHNSQWKNLDQDILLSYTCVKSIPYP